MASAGQSYSGSNLWTSPNGNVYNVTNISSNQKSYQLVSSGSNTGNYQSGGGGSTGASGSSGLIAGAASQITSLDRYVGQRFEEMIAKYMPGWKGLIQAGTTNLNNFLTNTLPSLISGERETYQQLRRTGAQYMTGQLPADVTAAVRRGAAVRGIEGQMGANLVGRDLGLTSVALQEKGGTFLESASNIAKNIAALNASAQESVSKYTDTAKAIAGLSGLDTSTLGSLTSNLWQVESAKYGIDVAARTNAAKIAEEARQANINVAEARRTQNLNIALSAFGQQMATINTATKLSLMAPQFSGVLTKSANDINARLVSFTNDLLRTQGSGTQLSRYYF